MTNNKNEIYRQHIRHRKLQHNCNGLESISNKYADRNLKTIQGKVLRAFQHIKQSFHLSKNVFDYAQNIC